MIGMKQLNFKTTDYVIYSKKLGVFPSVINSYCYFGPVTGNGMSLFSYRKPKQQGLLEKLQQ